MVFVCFFGIFLVFKRFLTWLGINGLFRVRRGKYEERIMGYKIKGIIIGRGELNRKLRKVVRELLEKIKLLY